jgi:uncharacterized ferritin-like protein (DUF455 family)
VSGANLFVDAETCLRTTDVDEKLALAGALRADLEVGHLALDDPGDPPTCLEAGRPERPELVAPADLPKRRLGSVEGQAALIHAVAHIEFNAINLACDAVYRFRGLPAGYYSDWVRVAAEEAYHFSLLRKRLHDLGYAYGDFAAHNGLWDLAVKTAADPLVRMALVPRVMEARGLDVTPGMIQRFEGIGDAATAELLGIILRDEIGHVEIGSRWFHHQCRQRGLDPETTYFALLDEYLPNGVRGPFHETARLQAGFSAAEMGRLQERAGGRGPIGGP